MKTRQITSITALAISWAAVCPAPAGVSFGTGNVQYENVNIIADDTGPTITGHIDRSGNHVTFQNMIGPDGSTQVDMHGQHGVAFIESAADAVPGAGQTGFSSLTLRADPGWGWAAGDFALSQLGGLASPTGMVTLTAEDQFGGIYTQILAISANGENHYNFSTVDNQCVVRLTISVPTTDLLQNFRGLSVLECPEPASLGVLSSLLGIAMIRRRQRA